MRLVYFKSLPCQVHVYNILYRLPVLDLLGLLHTHIQALQGLESKTVVKQDSWPACQDVLVQGAVRYQQLDFVAAALMERARQHEHLPQLVALLAKFAEEKHNSTQLVRARMHGECWQDGNGVAPAWSYLTCHM